MAVTTDMFRKSEEAIKFEAGQSIFHEGDAGDNMYVVVEGEVDLTIQGKLVETVKEGGILGEMALIEHQPRTASATARTDCRLVAVGEKRFLFLIQQTPFFAQFVMRVMAGRLRRMDNRL
jgi:CRP/FNR family transcriptional regulator, cyclic AMP receptor protein